jgi:hypothetical protein
MIGSMGKHSEFPVALIVVLVLFLLLQDRFDRKDPKLALAPIYPEPDLPFESSFNDANGGDSR